MSRSITPEMITIERSLTMKDGREALFFHTGWSSFSNFNLSPFVEHGVRYMSVQQYFESAKAQHFGDAEAEEAIMKTRSAWKSKMIGRSIKNFDSTEWNDVCENVMYV